MTNFAEGFRPPWAVTMWADDTHIYSEIPCVSGPPLIQRYSLTEGGLHSALTFLRKRHVSPSRQRVALSPHPLTKKAKPRPLPQGANEEDRAKVRAILKKRGLL